MPSFCVNCGSPLSANSAFCPQCGTPSGKLPNQPPPAAPVVIAPQSNNILKVVLVVVCLLAVAGVAVVGGVIYLAHRVKQAVVEKAAERGVDLGSIGSSLRRGEGSNQSVPKPCEVLSSDEASRLIGEPIERTAVQDVMCMYYGPAGLSLKLAKEQASGTFKRAQSPDSDVNGTEVANSVDQLMNNLAGETGQSANGEVPLLMLAVSGDGRSQMAALSASKAIFGGIGQAADANGTGGFGADISGLGDKAIRLPKLGLNVLKGEIVVRVITGPLPHADEKSIAIARAVLPRI